MSDKKSTVLCTCSRCGCKFRITALDLIAVHLGDYPTKCDDCRRTSKV